MKDELGLDACISMVSSSATGMTWVTGEQNFNVYLSAGLEYDDKTYIDMLLEGKVDEERFHAYCEYVGLIFQYLEKGAILKASGSYADYSSTGYHHNEMGDVHALLYSMHGADITISGEGTIDLSGHCFYDFDRPVPYKDFYDCRLEDLTEAQLSECCVVWEKRPDQPIFFYDCTRVCVRDISIVDSPCWTLTFVECTDVRAIDLTIDNSLRIPNCDGIHFSCCRQMLVRGCNISSGDDCIAFTCITDWNKTCEQAVVSDCIFRSCSKAISIGYAHSIVRDIAISNCIVRESNRACALMANPGTGLIEDVTLSNLRLDTYIYAGNWWGNGEPVCVMSTPHNERHFRDAMPEKRFEVSIRRILFQNLICSGENAIAVIGDGNSVQDVHMDGVFYARKPSRNLAIKGNMIDLAPGYQTAFLPEDPPVWLFVRGVRDCSFSRCRIAPFDGAGQRPLVEESVNVALDGVW